MPVRFAHRRPPPTSTQLQSVGCQVVKGASVGRSLTPASHRFPTLRAFRLRPHAGSFARVLVCSNARLDFVDLVAVDRSL